MTTEAEVFAVDFAMLAREIAMDIFDVDQILELHKLSQDEWSRISVHPRFVSMLRDMTTEWNAAANVNERVRIKAATGLESILETYITSVTDESIPLTQRVDAGKFLARLGDLDSLGKGITGNAGGGVIINISTGQHKPPLTIDAKSIPLQGPSEQSTVPVLDVSA